MNVSELLDQIEEIGRQLEKMGEDEYQSGFEDGIAQEKNK